MANDQLNENALKWKWGSTYSEDSGRWGCGGCGWSHLPKIQLAHRVLLALDPNHELALSNG